MGRATRIRYFIEWAALKAARAVARVLPHGCVVNLGAIAGEMAYRLGVRRRTVLENLARAFPDWSAAERRRVARRAYRNVGRTMIECLLTPILARGQIDRLVVGIEGREFLERIGETRKPFIVLTGHIGNWELMGAYFARLGYRLKVFAKPLHNPRVEAELLASRGACGVEVLPTGGGVRPGLRHLRAGGVLVFLADQDARKMGIAVPFFGVPASTATGPAVFALLGKVPILPVFALRVGSTRHRFHMFEPIDLKRGEERTAAIERITREHVGALEQFVREHPEQYFWFHRRWKTPAQKTAG